jgi:pimeloyl-ACP methyl ester carboxylesterase
VETVNSDDGTLIAFDRLGDGPPVVVVCGGSTDRMANVGLAEELAKSFTVYNFDRRGRGDSGDTPPYAVEREIEDITAVISAAGGSAHLFGTSSGAALVMEAAAAGSPINKLALWEPPYLLPPRPRPPADTAKIFSDFVAAGKRDEAVEFFMSKVVGLPDEFVAGARQAPFWKSQLDLAHTLAYDATIMGDYQIPAERAKVVGAPTVIVDGEASFEFMRETADALAQLIPNSERRTLPGQTHDVDPTALAPVLAEFFSS